MRRYIFLLFVLSITYCEFLGDFVSLIKCKWPPPNNKLSQDALHAMFIADTHLLGPIKGHWLDKFYREWHMRRAFQSALLLHKPHVVFILGDLFDEGDITYDDDFNEFVRRFRSHFQADVPVLSAVGNHDVGFHYRMHPHFLSRFEEQFNNTLVQLYTIRDNHFVFINSMALENDGCEFCETTIEQLHIVADKLKCLKRPETCSDHDTIQRHKHYSRPIIVQHFPTYRKSDKSCRQHDSPNLEEYREKWEVLSKNSTDWLGKLLRPRLAFAGHSHNYCYSINRWGVEEYTVASFSWRNKINPSFLMASLSSNSHEIYKCEMLEQNTVYSIYALALSACVLIITINVLKWLLAKRKTGIKIQ